jgi:hypothetical protein
VEIGFVNRAGLARWKAAGPVEVPTGEMAYKPVKLELTTTCSTVVIANYSAQAIKLRFVNKLEILASQAGG